MILNCKYKPKLQKYKLLCNNKLQTTQSDPNTKFNTIKKTLFDRLSTDWLANPNSPDIGGPDQELTHSL